MSHAFHFLCVPLQAPFLKKLDHMIKHSRTKSLNVEGGFYTKENMKLKLGWNKPRPQPGFKRCPGFG